MDQPERDRVETVTGERLYRMMGVMNLTRPPDFQVRYWRSTGEDHWQIQFTVCVPWDHLNLPTAQAVCQWLAHVMKQELQYPPAQ